MRFFFAQLFFAATVLLSSSGLSAQIYYSHDLDLLARLSYHNSSMEIGGLQHICVAVFRDGGYRVVRAKSPDTQWLEGTMPKEQFEQLKNLLVSAEFKSLAGNHGGLLRQDSESFAAEVPVPGVQRNKDRTLRIQWLNADGDSPFPTPMAKVVNWLKHFEPKDGKEFEQTENPDVCPTVGLRMLQPVASNLNP